MAIYTTGRLGYIMAPFTEGFYRGALLGLQEALRRKRQQERVAQLEQTASELAQALDLSPTQAYALTEPNLSLEAPTLRLSQTPAIQERIGEGLLPREAIESLPTVEKTAFVDVLKPPEEYTKQVYEKTLPLLTRASALGANFAPIVSAVTEAQRRAYEEKEKEAQQRQTLQRKTFVADKKISLLAKKAGAELDPETRAALAVGVASGDITQQDLRDIFKQTKGNVAFQRIEAPNGDVVLMALDKTTGQEIKRYVFPFDPSRLELEERVKAKYRRTTRGAKNLQKAPVKVPTEAYQKALEEGDTTTAVNLELMGQAFKNIYFLFDPDTGRYYTPNKKLPVNPNDPEDVARKLEMDRNIIPKERTKSVFDLFPDLKR